MYPELVVFHRHLGFLQLDGTFSPYLYLRSGAMVVRSQSELDELKSTIRVGYEDFEFIPVEHLKSVASQFIEQQRSPKSQGEV